MDLSPELLVAIGGILTALGTSGIAWYNARRSARKDLVATLQGEIERLNARLVKWEEVGAKRDEQRESLLRRVLTLETDNATLRQRVTNLESENVLLRQRVVILETENASLKMLNLALQTQVEALIAGKVEAPVEPLVAKKTRKRSKAAVEG